MDVLVKLSKICYNECGDVMQDKINQTLFIVIPLLATAFLVMVLIESLQVKEYSENIYYMDTYIYVKVYAGNRLHATEVLNGVEKIYKEYHELTNKYKEYKGLKNLYYIAYNTSKEETITIDKRLYQLLEYGKEVYDLTNGLIDISMGNVLDIWKSYRDSAYGVPTLEELQAVKTDSIEDIVLLEKNKILNNHVNIDLGAIAKGYVTELAAQYLEKEGITRYIINAGGNVIVGGNEENKKYSIGIEDPEDPTGIFKIIYGNNLSVVTSGGYNRYYEWDGKRYSHIINPNTLFPNDYMKSVTVICSSSKFADVLSTMLFMMDVDKGKEYVNSLDGVEAIWYTMDNQIITSDGLSKYETK